MQAQVGHMPTKEITTTYPTRSLIKPLPPPPPPSFSVASPLNGS